MDGDTVLKVLFIKNKFDIKKTLQDVRDKTELTESPEVKKMIKKFDDRYNSVTLINPEHRDLIRYQVDGLPELVVRWYKNLPISVKSLLTDKKQNKIALLDDMGEYDAKKFPDEIVVFGAEKFEDPDGNESYGVSVATGGIKVGLFDTPNLYDAAAFLAGVCDNLLVASKGFKIMSEEKFQFSFEERDVLMSPFEHRNVAPLCFAIPGKKGSYVNRFMKEADHEFCDCWNDITERVVK